jgi:hypothetical protein
VACDCKLELSVRTLGSSSPHLKRDLRLRGDEKEPFSVFFRELPPLRKCRLGVSQSRPTALTARSSPRRRTGNRPIKGERASRARAGQVRSEHTGVRRVLAPLLGEPWLGGDFHARLLDLLVRGCFKVL